MNNRARESRPGGKFAMLLMAALLSDIALACGIEPSHTASRDLARPKAATFPVTPQCKKAIDGAPNGCYRL